MLKITTSSLWPRKCENGRKKCFILQVWPPHNHVQPLSMFLSSSPSCPEHCVLWIWIICCNLWRVSFIINLFLPGLVRVPPNHSEHQPTLEDLALANQPTTHPENFLLQSPSWTPWINLLSTKNQSTSGMLWKPKLMPKLKSRTKSKDLSPQVNPKWSVERCYGSRKGERHLYLADLPPLGKVWILITYGYFQGCIGPRIQLAPLKHTDQLHLWDIVYFGTCSVLP